MKLSEDLRQLAFKKTDTFKIDPLIKKAVALETALFSEYFREASNHGATVIEAAEAAEARIATMFPDSPMPAGNSRMHRSNMLDSEDLDLTVTPQMRPNWSLGGTKNDFSNFLKRFKS